MKLNRESLKKLVLEELDRGDEYLTSHESGKVSDINAAIIALHKITDAFPGHEQEIGEFANFLQTLLDGQKPKPRTGWPDSPMR